MRLICNESTRLLHFCFSLSAYSLITRSGEVPRTFTSFYYAVLFPKGPIIQHSTINSKYVFSSLTIDDLERYMFLKGKESQERNYVNKCVNLVELTINVKSRGRYKVNKMQLFQLVTRWLSRYRLPMWSCLDRRDESSCHVTSHESHRWRFTIRKGLKIVIK